MSRHTPEPWEISIVDLHFGKTEEREHLYKINGEKLYEYNNGFGDESLANARLIAAAPELLEVCKNTLAMIAAFNAMKDTDYFKKYTVPQLEQAIAKAESKDV